MSTPLHSTPRNVTSMQQQQQQPYQVSPSKNIMQRKGITFQHLTRPLISVTNQILHPLPTGDSTNLCYSFKHAGLYLHISRLLRPIWKKKCIVAADGNSSLTNFDCAHILDDLYGVKSFIDTFSTNSMSNYINQHSTLAAFPGNDNTLNRQQLEHAMTEEKRSIGALALFISKCRFIC